MCLSPAPPINKLLGLSARVWRVWYRLLSAAPHLVHHCCGTRIAWISPDEEESLCSVLRDWWRERDLNYIAWSDVVSDPIRTKMAPCLGWTCYGYHASSLSQQWLLQTGLSEANSSLKLSQGIGPLWLQVKRERVATEMNWSYCRLSKKNENSC